MHTDYNLPTLLHKDMSSVYSRTEQKYGNLIWKTLKKEKVLEASA